MEIVNFQEVSDEKVLAKFDVYLGPVSGITYPNFKVLKGKTNGWYVSRPSYLKHEDPFGKKTWGSYPEMNAEKWKSLSSQLNELLKPLIKTSF